MASNILPYKGVSPPVYLSWMNSWKWSCRLRGFLKDTFFTWLLFRKSQWRIITRPHQFYCLKKKICFVDWLILFVQCLVCLWPTLLRQTFFFFLAVWGPFWCACGMCGLSSCGISAEWFLCLLVCKWTARVTAFFFSLFLKSFSKNF